MCPSIGWPVPMRPLHYMHVVKHTSDAHLQQLHNHRFYDTTIVTAGPLEQRLEWTREILLPLLQVKESMRRGQALQLRMVHPVLVGYCMQRTAAKALQVDEMLRQQVCALLAKQPTSSRSSHKTREQGNRISRLP